MSTLKKIAAGLAAMAAFGVVTATAAQAEGYQSTDGSPACDYQCTESVTADYATIH